MAPGFRRERDKDEPRANAEIVAPQVRLIGAHGENVGVVYVREAMRMAREAGLDLVEISPAAQPPVCKILNLGRYKYEQSKHKNEAKKKQKVVEIKELKLSANIDEHDYQTKLKAARRFFEDGDKVKMSL